MGLVALFDEDYFAVGDSGLRDDEEIEFQLKWSTAVESAS
jgi:hypothetical protein